MVRLFNYLLWRKHGANRADLKAARQSVFNAKWVPVRVKKTRQNKEIEPPFRFNRNGKGSGSVCRRNRRDAWRLRIKAENPDQIFVIFRLLLFEFRPRLGFMERVASRQEYARGDGKKLFIVFHDA